MVILPREVVLTFTTAAITALQELIGVEAVPADPGLLNPVPKSPGPFVSASLTLMRQIPGTMSLVLTEESASRLAALYLPEGAVSDSDMIDDVVGEFANVIAGQAKTVLKGTPHHFTMSTPVVARAATLDHLSHVAPASLAVSLETEPGQILLYVSLP